MYILAEDKKTLAIDHLDDLAFYTQLYDQELWEVLRNINELVEFYRAWWNIFHHKNMEEVRYSLPLLADRLTRERGYTHYEEFFSFWQDFVPYKDSLTEIFWWNGKRNYIVVLQNTAEKRPNWWFFWSFVFVSLEYGQIKEFTVIDSYLADWIAPYNRLAIPPWSQPFLLHPDFWFISSNKFWFTKMDGNNIRTLFNTTFADPELWRLEEKAIDPDRFNAVVWERIHGVVFVKSDGLTTLLPDLQEKLRERQFVNASIDLIRGESAPNKKELYKEMITEYFTENSTRLVENIFSQRETLLTQRTVQIYLPEDPEIEWLLRKYKLINTYDPSFLYAWDTNFSFNKSDDFITKEILFQQDWGESMRYKNKDIVLFPPETGEYTMDISYTLAVPDAYRSLISSFESRYDIKLQDRELGILALQPAYDFITKTYKWRATKAVVYFPLWTKIASVTWADEYSLFESPFAVGLAYDAKINDNSGSTTVSVLFTK